MSLWTPPEVPKEMPCEKCGELTSYKGLIGASLEPCEHCGAPRPHTPARTGCWPTIFLIFFVGAFPVALIVGEGAIAVIFPLFLLLYLVMFTLFIVGCVMMGWKMNWRATSGSLFFGLLVAAGSVCALYAIGSGAKAWMTPAVVAIVAMALISYGALCRIRILDQSEDPAGQEEKAGPEENLHEE
jgi:hypothetical protein